MCHVCSITVTNLTDNDGLVGFCSINLPSHLFHHLSIVQHESLANAKVSASHHCMYEGPSEENLRQINARKIMLKSTFSELQCYHTILVYLHSFSSCCLPSMQETPKILGQFELIAVEGHPRSLIFMSNKSAYVTSY